MHFCPQPACRKYYHRGCIASKTTTLYKRADFLLSDPDTGAALQLPLNESASAEPPKKRRRASHATTTISNPAPFDALLAALPSALVRAAAQPIVRGGVFGVAGNAAAVVAARRIVCSALRDSTGADGWEKQMPEGWEKTMPQGWDVEDVVLGGANAGENGVSPSKLSVSTGSSKGNRANGKGKATVDTMVVLQCPECGGPI
jgi:hypothetical protein